jgi:phage terminase small subunit
MESNKKQNKKEVENQTKSKLDDLKRQLIEDDISDFTKLQPTISEEFQRLEERQKLFVNEYLKDFNGTQAAIRAGYSEKTANVIASNLLTKVNIKNEITKRQQLIQEASNINKENVIKKLLELIEDCYNDEKTDRTSILKAMDMINKLTNLYAPENQINILNQNETGEIKITIIAPNKND